MSTLKISVNAREEHGRCPNRRLRAAGSIPAVIYGKSGSRSVSLNSKEFANLEHELGDVTPIVHVVDDSAEVRVLIQEVQRDALKDCVVHVDFLELTKGSVITAHIAVHAIGLAEGVKNEGGTLEMHLHEVEVKGRPSNLPEFIEIDVSELHTGDTIKLADLPVIEGVNYHMHADTVVIGVSGAKKEAEASEEEGSDEQPADAASEDSSE